MGFRFRKSFGAGPFKVNLSKSGIGYSVGGKGFRVTKKAGGGTRTTTSIPGTGISYTKDYSSNRRSSHSGYNRSADSPSGSGRENIPESAENMTELLLCLFLGWAGAHKFYQKKKGLGFLYLLTFGLFIIGWWGDAIQMVIKRLTNTTTHHVKVQKFACYLTAFLCVMVIGGCSSGGEPAPETTDPTIKARAETIEATLAASEIPTTLFTTAPTEAITEPETIETTAEPTTEPTVEPTTEATTEPETEAPTEALFTYILNTNTKKFHKPGCSSADDIKEKNK